MILTGSSMDSAHCPPFLPQADQQIINDHASATGRAKVGDADLGGGGGSGWEAERADTMNTMDTMDTTD